MESKKWYEKLYELFLKHKAIAVPAFVALVALVCLIGQCGCPAIGVSDPEVRSIAYEVTADLDSVYEFSDDADEALAYLAKAKDHVLQWRSLESGKITADDNDKITRLLEGIDDVIANISSPPYVRQRARSLKALADSVGVYDTDELQGEATNAVNAYKPEPEEPPAQENTAE